MSAGRDWTGRERDWMAQALALAALADGQTSPNPLVGCVLVKQDRVVGRGFHRAPGEPHAEAIAVREAGGEARGATLVVNLEPCAHVGRTLPCSEALIASGVARVLASMQDPNPLVNGRGFEQLRRAGIEVRVGLLEDEARRLNEPFIRWHERGLPMVTLKAAISADGMLAARDGCSRWISGPEARRFAHRLRWRHDAVLVGVGTVRRDDPRLTVRLGGREAARRRAVFSRSLDLDPRAAVFDESTSSAGRTLVFTPAGADGSRAARLASAEVVELSAGDDAGFVRRALEQLAARGIQSVLVEGGGQTLASFVASGLAQRVALFTSARMIGARGARPLLDGDAAAAPDEAWRVAREQIVPLGDDLLLLGRLVGPARPGRER
ncbi:MAG TPA: bifunctional diaminohydroxyphosphoribosylaminopyrimidine deaminase/5-amino-6-(5-phosphoribosylamino)uracil reductase RibD [Candidatus Polarisedimenticolaceae bacterium]|nr:bifunctional diaminohydroxyphosphoribosylaminopyrimidine deaminase/5-amino-6-(5-phosphoribosylamino)uracil reductase RibD [Candidatus Polarisedimenticolaceae bacterium]